MTQISVSHQTKESRIETLPGYSTKDAAWSMYLICFGVAVFMLVLKPGYKEMFEVGGWWILYYVVAEILCLLFAFYGSSQANRKSSRMVRYEVSDKLDILAVGMPLLLPASPCLLFIGIFFGVILLEITHD